MHSTFSQALATDHIQERRRQSTRCRDQRTWQEHGHFLEWRTSSQNSFTGFQTSASRCDSWPARTQNSNEMRIKKPHSKDWRWHFPKPQSWHTRRRKKKLLCKVMQPSVDLEQSYFKKTNQSHSPAVHWRKPNNNMHKSRKSCFQLFLLWKSSISNCMENTSQFIMTINHCKQFWRRLSTRHRSQRTILQLQRDNFNLI